MVEHVFEASLVHRYFSQPADGSPCTGGVQISCRMLQLPQPRDAVCACVSQFAVGAGADAEIVAVTPIVQVVPTLPALAGVRGNLVVTVAGLRQASLTLLLHLPDQILIRQFWRVRVEQGVGFERELVMGNVRRVECNRL